MAVYIIMAAAGLAAVIFGIRWLTLRRAVKDAAAELSEVTADIRQNRIVRLTSPQKELEQLLLEINSNLEEIRRERNRYEEQEQKLQREIENISHDLRTPLTAILGYLNFMDEDSMDEETKESLNVVRRKTRQLSKLVVQFYDLTRLTNGSYRLKLKETDLGRTLREQAADNYREMKKHNLTVDIDIPEHPVNVLADEDALDRIFDNLFQNAARYAVSRLSIKVTEQDGYADVLFENDTEELNRDTAEHLFDRFYTQDTSRSGGSTGLGLSITRYLAEEMNGNISAEVYERDGRSWLAIEMRI